VTKNKLPLNSAIPHSLGRTPEMIWGKNRNNTFVWGVYHKGVSGGADPEQYRLKLNANDGEADSPEAWNDTAPTATHFTVGLNHTGSNGGADWSPIFILFASVEGISKVGSYTGNGSNTGPSVTTGFQPRLIIAKRADSTGDWYIYDSVRGFGTVGSNHGALRLNSSSGEVNSSTYFQVSSTGFSVHDNSAAVNANNGTYVYYTHA